MAASKRVRWECPHGIHPAVLGSTRPRANATVRYCLACSQEAGVLVGRVASALERQRAGRTAAAERRRDAKRDREREQAARAYVVAVSDGELDLREEMDAFMRGSEELRSWLRETGRTARWRPRLVVRRGTKRHVSGHCDWDGEEITLTVGSGATLAETREILLHELVHAVTCWAMPSTGRHPAGREWHGGRFRGALCRAAKELFGTTVHPDDHRQAYGLDRLIVKQMLEMGPATLAEVDRG